MRSLPAAQYSFRLLEGQEQTKFPGDVNGQPFSIEEVVKSDLSVLDFTETLSLHTCRDSSIRCGPTIGSCKITDCSDCEIAVACGHLTVADCENVRIYLFTSSEPEVERSSGIVFAPYNLAYPDMQSHFSRCGLEVRKNYWSRVRADGEYGSCWTILPESLFVMDRREIRGMGQPQEVVPRHVKYGGTQLEEFIVGSQERSNRSSTRTPRKPLPNTDAYAFRFKDNEELTKLPGDIAGHTFSLEELKDCAVNLYDVTETLDIRTCTNTKISCGPTKGTCRISNCIGCMIAVACGRLIVKDCIDVMLFIYSATEPELEGGQQVMIAPYNLAYPGLRAHFLQAGLDPRKNLWSRVRAQEPVGQTWGILSETEFFLDRKELPGMGSPEDPVLRPVKFSGTVPGEVMIGSQETPYAPPPILFEFPLEQPHPPEPNFQPPAFPRRLPSPREGEKQIAKDQMTASGDAKAGGVVIAYDGETGFAYASDDPALANVPNIFAILSELTEQVHPHRLYLDMLKVSLFALCASSLLLYLIVILLLDFVDMHLAGLIINLIIVTVFLSALGTVLLLRWRSRAKLCNEAVSLHLMTHKTTYESLGIEVLADINRVVVKSLIS